MSKSLFYSSVAALLMAAAPAFAQAPGTGAAATAAVKTGDTVYDTNGGVVGTVDSVSAGVAVVSTGKNKVGVPIASFGAGDKGPRIAITRDQLDQAAVGAKAQQQAAVTTGATVVDSQGVQIGKIQAVEADGAVVALADTQVKLPLNAFATRDSGLMVGMTKAQLEAAANAAAPRASTAATPQ